MVLYFTLCHCEKNSDHSLHCRLGRLGDPGVSPPPRQGVVLAMVRTGLGTRLSPCFNTENPEVGFSVVGIRNAITNVFHWLGSWKPTLWLQPL